MDPRTGGSGGRRPRKFFAGVREELLKFADHQFSLDKLQQDGHSQREHLQAAVRNGGPAAAIAQAELERTTCPEGAEHIYGWFLELSARRGFGPGGAFALSFADIDAWQRVRVVRLLAHELEWILALDARWFRPQKAEGE